MPSVDRKSGIPLSVEIPAPVRTTQGCLSRTSSASCNVEMGELYIRFSVSAFVALALASPAPTRVGRAGVTVARPPGWHAPRPDQGSVTNPLTRIVVSSGPIHSDLVSRCQTLVASSAFPKTAVAIVVVEWTQPISGMKIGVGPPKPRHFTAANLPVRRAVIECFDGPGGSIEFAARHHTFAAYVMLGRRAPARLANQARAVLGTLQIAPR